jgi:hypothetical protein
MIKKTLTGLIAVMLALTAFAQQYNCAEMGLKGAVKSIRETQYKMNEINPGLNEILITTFQFDRNCRKTVEETIDVGGDPINKHTVVYDKAGRILSENKNNAAVNGNFTHRYKYNAAGQLEKKEVLSSGKVISTYLYTYDDNNNAVAMEIKKKPGLMDIHDEKFEYSYDANNRRIEEVHIDGDEYSRTKYEYNDKNQLIRRTEYNRRGGVTYDNTYVFDELDNPSAESASYRGNNINNFSYVYEYDAQGNWINKRSQSNEKTFCLQIRVITYY